jgi:branched-chain amino acid transport system permease protein
VAFTFATLFFQELALLFTRKLEVTGGSGGLVLQTILPVWLPHTLMVLTATGATIAMLFLLNSRAGIRLLAIKDDEDAAAAIGIEAAPRKVIVFCASAAICGLVGAIHALFTSGLYPEIVFQVDLSLVALAVPLIGGVGTAFGPVLGALLYMGAREMLQIVAPSLHLIIVGLLILLVTLFMRAGIGPELWRLMRRMRGRELKAAASSKKEVC